MAGIDHYFDSAILLPALRIVGSIRIGIRRHRSSLTVAFARGRSRHELMPYQPVLNSIGALLAKVLVVFGGTNGISMTFYRRRMIS